ncbi:alpha-actinin-4 [Striga asiatica]|uniref:Alpha-actinin-4 n=1 Tax=Striga asiatica TaxID=4170 RepID=A0A5A7QGI9_STRAF|nr:alpha-actinin-4 [Striga asiatica]
MFRQEGWPDLTLEEIQRTFSFKETSNKSSCYYCAVRPGINKDHCPDPPKSLPSSRPCHQRGSDAHDELGSPNRAGYIMDDKHAMPRVFHGFLGRVWTAVVVFADDSRRTMSELEWLKDHQEINDATVQSLKDQLKKQTEIENSLVLVEAENLKVSLQLKMTLEVQAAISQKYEQELTDYQKELATLKKEKEVLQEKEKGYGKLDTLVMPTTSQAPPSIVDLLKSPARNDKGKSSARSNSTT